MTIYSYLQFFHSFPFCWSDWVNSTALRLSWVILSSALSGLLLNPCSIFYSSVIAFFSSVISLYFSYLCWSFSLCSFILLPVWWSFLWPLLNSLSAKLLYVSLMSFGEVLSCSLIWDIFVRFFILVDSLCWFLYSRWNNHLSTDVPTLGFLQWMVTQFRNLWRFVQYFSNLKSI